MVTLHRVTAITVAFLDVDSIDYSSLVNLPTTRLTWKNFRSTSSARSTSTCLHMVSMRNTVLRLFEKLIHGKQCNCVQRLVASLKLWYGRIILLKVIYQTAVYCICCMLCWRQRQAAEPDARDVLHPDRPGWSTAKVISRQRSAVQSN